MTATDLDAAARRRAALREYDVLGDVLRDVLRVDAGRTGPGQRPALGDLAPDRLRSLLGEDYTTMPFHVALRAVAVSDPVVDDVTAGRMSELLAGAAPTDDELLAAAAAYGKHPAYFTEYRARLLTSIVHEHLHRSPEATIRWINELGLGAA